MSFNLRVVAFQHPYNDNPDDILYTDYLVCAVYYNEQTRRPEGINFSPETCNDPEVAANMLAAFEKPIAAWVNAKSVYERDDQGHKSLSYKEYGFYTEKEIKFAPATEAHTFYNTLPEDDLIDDVRVYEQHLINGRIDLAIGRLMDKGFMRHHAVNICIKYLSICKDTILFGTVVEQPADEPA